ncbi:MAG TPA: glutamate--tRNA ligase [Patescibacteria group bacterium]|nr:glutamate--tRNA ligase [Patescibacteria group bacterium]
MTRIRTRFAPSPTGSLHIGGLRTALYSYALAKKNKGDFILRIEDTDKKREVKGAKEKIGELLKTFGLAWDEYFVQSERAQKGIYKKAAEKLLNQGNAFYCQCLPKNAKEKYSMELRDPCRDKDLKSGAIKLKVPDNQKISFKDYVLGKEIGWNTNDLADTTLLKSDGFPTYHLAVVVDDNDMKITHVLRGHDWMPSTPIHLLVYKFLGFENPQTGHLTDILDPEGGKLSKRKGSTSCEGLLEEGYLPQAVLNFIMLLGWAPKDNRELFTLEEFVETFNPKGLQKSNPIFNKDKLNWFNREYVRKLPVEELNSKFETQNSKFAKMDKSKQLEITNLVRERIEKLEDFNELTGFFFETPKVSKSLLGKNYEKHLSSTLDVFVTIENWKIDEINTKLMQEITKQGFKTGDFFMDLRIAITGSKFTPPINESIVILGKEESLSRIKKTLSI